MIQVSEYVDETGRSPFGAWFERLDTRSAVKVSAAVIQMEHGNFSDSKGVGAGVIERRVHYGPGYRIYFGRDGNELVILLAGGDKHTQEKDITVAQDLWRAYKRRKKRDR